MSKLGDGARQHILNEMQGIAEESEKLAKRMQSVISMFQRFEPAPNPGHSLQHSNMWALLAMFRASNDLTRHTLSFMRTSFPEPSFHDESSAASMRLLDTMIRWDAEKAEKAEKAEAEDD